MNRIDNGSDGTGFPPKIVITKKHFKVWLSTQSRVETASRTRCPMAIYIRQLLHGQYRVEVEADTVRLIAGKRSQDYEPPRWMQSFLEALDAKKHHFLERPAPTLTARQTLNIINRH